MSTDPKIPKNKAPIGNLINSQMETGKLNQEGGSPFENIFNDVAKREEKEQDTRQTEKPREKEKEPEKPRENAEKPGPEKSRAKPKTAQRQMQGQQKASRANKDSGQETGPTKQMALNIKGDASELPGNKSKNNPLDMPPTGIAGTPAMEASTINAQLANVAMERGLPKEVFESIVKNVYFHAKEEGDKEFRLEMNHKNFKQLGIRINVKDGAIQVEFSTQDKNAQELLNATKNQLKEALQEKRLEVDIIRVV